MSSQGGFDSQSVDTSQITWDFPVMHWFKLYHEFASDPKVQSMSELMQRRLIMLFCLQCSDDLPKLDEEELALALRITPEELQKTGALFRRKGFIAEGSWSPTNWEKRQASLDRTAAERMRRYRASLRDQNRNVTANVTRNDDDERNVTRNCNGLLRVELELDKEKEEDPPIVPPEGDVVEEVAPKRSRNRKPVKPVVLPDWLPVSDWNAFVEMRAKNDNPLTPYAMELAIKKLGGFRDKGYDVVAILQESILRGWQGLFAPDDGKAKFRANKPDQGQLTYEKPIAYVQASPDSIHPKFRKPE